MEARVHWITDHGYLGIFSSLMLGILGLPIPDELVLTFAGYLVRKGRLDLVPTIGSAFLGSVCGVTLSYLLGRTAGFYLVRKYGRTLHVTPEALERVNRWFTRMGRWSLTVGYFLPGVRHLTAYLAGTAKLPIPSFALFAYSGGLLWSAVFVCTGYFLGERWEQLSAGIHRTLLGISLAVILLVALYSLARWAARRRGT